MGRTFKSSQTQCKYIVIRHMILSLHLNIDCVSGCYEASVLRDTMLVMTLIHFYYHCGYCPVCRFHSSSVLTDKRWEDSKDDSRGYV